MMHAEKLNEIVLDKNDAVLTQLNIAFNTFRQFAEEAQDAHNAIHLFELQDMLAEKMGSHDKFTRVSSTTLAESLGQYSLKP